ncbi:response regulator [Clostridium thailandense]|uniref:response regulator transcription factor n=1 Tax=Clostridium thailandense TaxID=2794346 RepID=UPI003989F5AF
MFKLLIADDEARIRKGLKNSLNWSDMNIEIVGEAEDGEIALKIIEDKKPDIILIDICMPFLNGLDLIEKIKSSVSNSIIIIISGYDEFSYAQRALKLRVFDYILKPVDSKMLEGVILRATKELNKFQEKRNYLEWTNKHLEENSSALKQSFLNNWLSGKLTHEQLIDELDFFNINIGKDVGLIVIKVVERLALGVAIKSWDKKMLNFAIINIACEVLNKPEPILTFIDDDGNIVVIMNIDQNKSWHNVGALIEEKIYDYLHYTAIVDQKKVSNILTVRDCYISLINDINKKTQYKPVVLLVMKYICKNYCVNDLNLEKVSKEFNVSSSYLSKLLKQQIGMSFIDYVTSVRINKAMCIMEDPTVKIYEVAELVGYSNQHYFCKAFKKIMGFPPTEFRGGISN